MFDSFCIPMNAIDDDIQPNPLKVIDTISEYLDIPTEKVTSKQRGREEVTFARHLSIYVLRQRTALSLKEIAIIFKKNYTTMFHAISIINDYVDTNHPRAKIINKFLNYAY